MSGDTVAAPMAVDLDALSAAATPGEWQQGVEWNRNLTAVYDESNTGITLCLFGASDATPYQQRLADARFIAAAVNFTRRTLRAQPSATLGGVTADVQAALEAHAAIYAPDGWKDGRYIEARVSLGSIRAARRALSLQNATPDATRARETGE